MNHQSTPFRVAIIGSGPSGFYAAEKLLNDPHLLIEVDMFDKLPLPFGLVRYGVAPDHQKIKSVVTLFERIAAHPNYRFFGNVALGEHVTVEQLRRHYHQIVYAVGAQTDRPLNLPGIDSVGSHSATEFVAWYNGHPDFRAMSFDLSQERVAIVGMGNVAVDVARILCRTVDELAQTDIADYALEALRDSKVREVYLLGRRGVAQAAFSPKEIRELGEMADAQVVVDAENVRLDVLSEAELKTAVRATRQNVKIVHSFVGQHAPEKSKRLHLRFLTSPMQVMTDDSGCVRALCLAKNELVAGENGRLQARSTHQYEELPVGLLFRSIGYRGVPIDGIPFNEKTGTFWHRNGRIVNPLTQQAKTGEYTVGWIKRGPTGVIGTNKPDAVETVEHMLSDIQKGVILLPQYGSAAAAMQMVQSSQPDFVTYQDWQYLDAQEQLQGQIQGRPRLKYTSRQAVLTALRQRS